MEDNVKKLLFIVAEEDILNILKSYSEEEKFKYEIRSSYNDALKSLTENKFDLIVTDYSTSYKEFKTIRSEKLQEVPFLFILNEKEKVDNSILLESGAEEFIELPINIEELKFKLMSLFKRSEIYKAFIEKSGTENKVISEANKILLIDDDIKLIKLFEYNLTKAGFEVKVALGGKQALEIVKSYQPDIFVCDIMMPEMDGYELRRIMLQDQSLRSIPFVFLTAKGDENDILEGYDLEIEDYIIKTAGPRVVVAKVSAILKSLDKERKKMVSEINRAADSFRAKVVPDDFPVFAGFDIKHWHQPFKGIPGGDFIDYFPLNEDNLVIVLGDVMGKKWGAWYFAFAYAGYVRSAIRVVLQSAKEFTPSVLLQKINESVYQDAKVSEVFATLSIIILDKKNRTAKYAGAGDLPVVFRNSLTNKVELLSSKGMLLGFSAEGEYSDVTINLDAGDILLLHTDGITESRNPEKEQFGSERFQAVVGQSKAEDNLLEKIKQDISTFTNNNFEDDISLIVIKVN